MIAILTKIFNYGQSTGIFAAGIAFILAVWKAVLLFLIEQLGFTYYKAFLRRREPTLGPVPVDPPLPPQDQRPELSASPFQPPPVLTT